MIGKLGTIQICVEKQLLSRNLGMVLVDGVASKLVRSRSGYQEQKHGGTSWKYNEAVEYRVRITRSSEMADTQGMNEGVNERLNEWVSE